MEGRGAQRFAAKGSMAQKLIKRIVKLVVNSPNESSKISETFALLYDTDPNLSQSLIYSIENLIYEKNDIAAAKLLFLHTTSTLASKDSKQCLDFVYSCDPLAIGQDSLKLVFELHYKEEHYLASLLILDGVSQEHWVNERRTEIADLIKDKDLSKVDIIYQNLANLLLLKRSKISGQGPPNVKKTKFFSSLLQTPIVAWEYRNQLGRMIRRDLDVKYQKSILGWAWGIIEPLALTVTFLFLFDILSTTTSRYMPLNIMIGIIIWSGFGHILLRGTKSLESNTVVLQRVNLPRQIFLLNIAGTSIVTVSLNILAIIPLLIYYQITPTWKLILFPASLILVAAYGVSVSLFTSTIQTKWRDVSHLVSVAVRIGFYFTPVFFTLEMLINGRIPPEFLTAYLIINPIAIYLTLARSAFTNESIDIGQEYFWISLLHLILLYTFSAYWFSKNEDKAVKYL
ncbi:MAG: ABC transporter permease [Candidatus Thalassarchaeum sp.]|nr:ABC transporter permease [Candidatus Thalassarchaeum sp.]